MKRTIVLALLLGFASSASASAQTVDTDVYLAPIQRIGDSIVVGTPVNVTRRPGYDNQPSFTADSRSVLYTAQSEGQTDIWRYDIRTRAVRRLTNTPESEYSATQMPGAARFSVIRVERDSVQRLWSFALSGSDPRLVRRDLKPVGYHAWLGPTRLAAYVLGSPSTLHLIDRDGSHDTVVARDVGRALQPVPAGAKALFTFTRRDSTGHQQIYVYTGRKVTMHYAHKTVALPASGALALPRTAITSDSVVTSIEAPYALVAAPTDNEYHAWTPDAVLVTASSSRLLRWNATLGAGSAWLPVADLGAYGVKNVSRIAFSPDGRWLAFVAEPATP
jgi:hypothetical protein